MWIVNTFSQIVAWLFILLIVSFIELKFKILTKYSYQFSSFMDHVLLYLKTLFIYSTIMNIFSYV